MPKCKLYKCSFRKCLGLSMRIYVCWSKIWTILFFHHLIICLFCHWIFCLVSMPSLPLFQHKIEIYTQVGNGNPSCSQVAMQQSKEIENRNKNTVWIISFKVDSALCGKILTFCSVCDKKNHMYILNDSCMI